MIFKEGGGSGPPVPPLYAALELIEMNNLLQLKGSMWHINLVSSRTSVTVLTPDISCFANNVDPDQLASTKPSDQVLHSSETTELNWLAVPY